MNGDRRRSTLGILGVATALFLLVILETRMAPWAPFHVVYAVLATLIPFAAGAWSFAAPRARERRTIWVLVLIGPLALQAAAGLIPGAADLGPALETLFRMAAERWSVEAGTIRYLYLGFVVAWAGLGEELFYRGYMHGGLRDKLGPLAASLISAAFFATRHPAQLALLWPGFPWAAAIFWAVFSFLAGLYLSWLYERSGSLRAPVVAHYLLNLIPLVALVLAPPAAE